MMNKVTAGTVARTAVLALALINQILTSTGHPVIPIQDEQLTELISLSFTVITSLVAWWKNNSFTKAAIAGDAVMHELKDGSAAESDVLGKVLSEYQED